MDDINAFNADIIEEFRAKGGAVGGMFEGMTLLLLHTKGAKSGQQRINPLAYQAVGDNYAVFASKAGAPDNPDWYHNLRANPEVRVEVGGETVDATARVLDGEEREAVWSKQKSNHEQFAEYEANTARTIPVVLLERR